jgi:muramidase (phage lysozyme)
VNRALVIAAGVGILAAAAWYARRGLGVHEALEAELEDLVGLTPTAAALNEHVLERNVAAFLAMIRHAEGTAGPTGPRMLFGGKLFDHFADHPRIAITRPSGSRLLTSTAAGAFQILARTWDDVQRVLELPDFALASQEIAAVFLIRRRGALADLRAGRFDQAIAKCSLEWASLPGSPYGQPVKSLEHVREIYAGAGGSFA